MALAQQLAELALANSQGLLNDDEYRLLRQNLFEQHSNSALIPVEAPILPVAGPGRKSSRPPTVPTNTRVRIQDTHVDSGAPRLRRKTSFTAGLSNILRAATGKTPVSPSAPSHVPPRPPSASSAEAPKRGVIPRLHRKASELFSGRSDGKRANPTTNSPRTPPSDSAHARHPSHTPLQSTKRAAIPTFPATEVDASSSSDVFDDGNLHTAKDIRAAMIATETEAQKLLEAFNGLESTTSFRVHQQTARRLPSTTPEHVNAVIGGTEWRNYRPPKPPSPLPSHFDRKANRYVATVIDTNNDSSSIRSGSSSVLTSISRSKSISSLRSKQHPASPLSSRFPTSPPSILRKNSVSSISSQGTSVQRLGVTGSSSLSRSTGHLPLEMLVETQDPHSSSVDRERSGYANLLPEVSEIQRRRDEVMARYVARLEYLQARLKSAELHEKLLRR
ncbi:hypothetical protein FPV67DRAFT_1482845 [Lyophyllum atratum]|nr:hypothetical protein FPV67DRAFT_1482845 [Lyophyllum atratum]